ncbi:MAG: hypothetical protein LBH45_04970 [Campylobacteraceae bacterium]|jgi:tetratricopeptide (TPR) repeat protein|nr:hypothetical protein [Campylobacteraceae bacterium]
MLKTDEVLIIEEQWREFKNKKIFKKIIIFFSILLSILLLVLLYLILGTQKNVTPKSDVLLSNTTNETNQVNITNATTQNYDSTNNTEDDVEEINSTVDTPIDTSTVETLYVSPQIIVEPPEEKKIIIETNNIQNINELIRKFENTNNVVFANMISEEFYEKKDYRKSLEYALKANEIDPKNELSWIIFAKSQVKLGKKEDAIKALEVFIKSSKNSQNAISLLQKIRNGEFR